MRGGLPVVVMRSDHTPTFYQLMGGIPEVGDGGIWSVTTIRLLSHWVIVTLPGTSGCISCPQRSTFFAIARYSSLHAWEKIRIVEIDEQRKSSLII